MKNNYITYRPYGLGLCNNLVYSYIVGWGDKGTYATNQQIADTLEVSVETVKRALRLFNKRGYIKITNSGKRNRHIYMGQNVPNEEHIDPQSGSERPSSGSDRPSKGVTETLYNIDTINNKIDNMISNNISNDTGENYFEDFMNRKTKYDEIKKS